MTLAGKIARILPVRVRDFALSCRDSWRLRQVLALSCDVTALARFDATALRRALGDPIAEGEWPLVAAEIAPFAVTASAGGVNPGDRRALYYLIRSLKPSRVLEVGTHIGASTVHIAAALRVNARAGGSVPHLTTVDIQDVNDPTTTPWKQYGSSLAPAEMVRRLGMTDRVTFVTRKSLDFLADTREQFDLIFLDGDHGASTVYRELPAALARLAPGGLIALHDYFPGARPLWPGDPVIPGPWRGVERLRREGARLTVLPLGDLPWPTKLGRNVTSLALVTSADRP